MILTDTHQEALLNSYFPNGFTVTEGNAYLAGIIKGIEMNQNNLKQNKIYKNKMSKANKTSDKQENGNDFIADVRQSFLLSKGFRQIEDSHLYKVDLPTDGTSLISDIDYNLWMEYWHDGIVDQSVGLVSIQQKRLKHYLVFYFVKLCLTFWVRLVAEY